jgi:hypothetical protein
MSSADIHLEVDETMMMCCASCGIAGVDEIKLKTCTACKFVRYCSVKCQRDHRLKHKKACKKRAAELREETLFKQPESTHEGDCPICFLPHPLFPEKPIVMACCSKLICVGCHYANQVREIQGSLEQKCPFCRHPSPKSDEEVKKNLLKRIEVNDPVAICGVAKQRYHEEGDYNGAIEYYTTAAGLGDVEAHFQLSDMYREGQGVEKDKKKEMYHLEEAAIGGHPSARRNLAVCEFENGRFDKAVKHWIISAKLGHVGSMKAVEEGFLRGGLISKEDYAAALREHQAAVDATKSPQREEAKAAEARCRLMMDRHKFLEGRR